MGEAWQLNCMSHGVRDGDQKGEVLKTCRSVRNDAAPSLCRCVLFVARLLRFGRAGGGKAPRSTRLLDKCHSITLLIHTVCVYIADQSKTVIRHDIVTPRDCCIQIRLAAWP